MANRTDPLNYRLKIVNPDGTPTAEFLRQWQAQRQVNQLTDEEITTVEQLVAAVEAIISSLSSTEIGGDGTNITPSPAPLSDGNITLTLPTQGGVTPGTYGSSTEAVVLTINNKGVVTSVTTEAISGGGGGSGNYFAPFNPPETSDFSTVVSEGGGTGSASDDATRGLLVTADGAGNDDWYGVYKSASLPVSGTDTYIFRMLYTPGPNGFPGAAFALRNSTSGRKLTFGIDGDYSAPPVVAVQRWNGASFGSGPFGGFQFQTDFWFKVEVTSAGLCTFFASRDGAQWYQCYSENVSSYLNAAGGSFDQIGFAAKYHNQTTRMSVPFFSDDGSNS